jgi:hypothetical protein
VDLRFLLKGSGGSNTPGMANAETTTSSTVERDLEGKLQSPRISSCAYGAGSRAAYVIGSQPICSLARRDIQNQLR